MDKKFILNSFGLPQQISGYYLVFLSVRSNDGKRWVNKPLLNR